MRTRERAGPVVNGGATRDLRWDPRRRRTTGNVALSVFFLFRGPRASGPCRTCTRTGPRSTVTAFHLTSPYPSRGPPLFPLCAPPGPYLPSRFPSPSLYPVASFVLLQIALLFDPSRNANFPSSPRRLSLLYLFVPLGFLCSFSLRYLFDSFALRIYI